MPVLSEYQGRGGHFKSFQIIAPLYTSVVCDFTCSTLYPNNFVLQL